MCSCHLLAWQCIAGCCICDIERSNPVLATLSGFAGTISVLSGVCDVQNCRFKSKLASKC